MEMLSMLYAEFTEWVEFVVCVGVVGLEYVVELP